MAAKGGFTHIDKVENLIVACLSLAGGASIIIGYIVSFSFGQNRLRQRIVLGLGVVDFILALSVVVSTSMSLAGHVFKTNSAACNFLGFLYQTCTIVSAAWTLIIAVITYTTIVQPLSGLSRAFDKRWASLIIWTVAYIIGIVPSLTGAIIWDIIDIGGICYYRLNSVEGRTMLFVPRAVALVGTIGFYIALFVFFRRRDLSMFSNTVTSTVEEEDVVVTHISRRRLGSLASWNRQSSDMSQVHTQALPILAEMDDCSPVVSLNQRPSVGSDDTAVTPTKVGERIIVALPRDIEMSQHVGKNAGKEDGLAAAPTVTSPDTSVINSSYRCGSDSVVQPSQVESGTKKLSARQLNRRLSLLMGLYPLAYFVLFSVSVARLTVQMITNDYVNVTFARVSRLLVLAQGLVDGILYLVIELSFRRSVKGRT